MKLASTTSPALSYLASELQWLRLRLTTSLREMQSIGVLPGAEAYRVGAAIYPQEVEARLHELKNLAFDRTEAEVLAKSELFEFERTRHSLLPDTDEVPFHFPLAYLRHQYSLSDDLYTLLLLVAAPAFSPTFPRLYGFIQNNFDRQFPTLALYLEIFAKPQDYAAYADLLDPSSTLMANKLIELRRSYPHLPLIYQPLALPTRIQKFIAGAPYMEPSILPYTELREIEGSSAPLLLSEKYAKAWQNVMQKLEHYKEPAWRMPVTYITGPHGAGKRRRAQDIAALLGKNLLCVDIRSLYHGFEAFYEGLATAMREAVLQNAILCLYNWDDLILPTTAEDSKFHAEVSSLHQQVCRLLDIEIASCNTTIVICSNNSVSFPPRLVERNVELVHIPYPDHRSAYALWSAALPEHLRDKDCDIKAFSENFHLTPGQIIGAVNEAAFRSQPSNSIDSAEIIAAVKEQMRHRLSEHATLIEKNYRWEDLIVPRDVETQLREIVSRYKYRAKVLSEWGLGDRFGHDLGLSALFDGPPGTGKSMCAVLIANEIGIDVYQVDLSRVMSKYVGETEKNLAQIFNEAENAQAMLLFDEADSLFGSRTNVKNSNDKYANLEVNYLLQRIERFPGVAILTTNFPAGIDEAFARRLSLRVSFPKPSRTERARLWASMLKNNKLPKDKIDYRDLANEFEISGGYIRNAILRAAFIAAANDEVITQDTLYTAARIEMKSMGMLVSSING
ncbi:MAG: ATP-binding protein [Bradymonadales bacterium]